MGRHIHLSILFALHCTYFALLFFFQRCGLGRSGMKSSDDENAIAVMDSQGRQLGFLSRDIAEQIFGFGLQGIHIQANLNLINAGTFELFLPLRRPITESKLIAHSEYNVSCFKPLFVGSRCEKSWRAPQLPRFTRKLLRGVRRKCCALRRGAVH